MNKAWKEYERKGSVEARPHSPGENLSDVSVNDEDTPSQGGMIARNPANHNDKWYIAEEYFNTHYVVYNMESENYVCEDIATSEVGVVQRQLNKSIIEKEEELRKLKNIKRVVALVNEENRELNKLLKGKNSE